jgi:hypothetical protein
LYTDKNFLNAEGPTSTKVGIEGLIAPMMLLGILGITFVFILKATK